MKKYLSIMLLTALIYSCKKDEPTPEPTPTAEPTPTPTPFQYSGDNMAGKWKLDSVYVWDGNANNYQTQKSVTYMPSEVGGAFTMEIYFPVFNETTLKDEKSTVVKVGDDLKVENRPHGYPYGGYISVDDTDVKIAQAIVNFTNDVKAEENAYHFSNGGLSSAESLFRTYSLVNNNHLVVKAEGAYGTKLREYFTRVN